MFPFSFVGSNQSMVVSSPFDPNSISGLKLWLKADVGVFSDAGTTLAVNSDPAYQWNDQSGNGYNMIQSTSGKRPIFTSSVLNGHPVIIFDGINDNMFATFPTISQPNTIFVVLNVTAYGGYIFESTLLNRQFMVISTATTIGISANGGASYMNFPMTIPTGYLISSMIMNGTSSVMRKNGTQTDSGNFGSLPMTNLMIGSDVTDTANFGNNRFAEILIYNSALSNSDILDVESYLNTKYSIY